MSHLSIDTHEILRLKTTNIVEYLINGKMSTNTKSEGHNKYTFLGLIHYSWFNFSFISPVIAY